MLDIDPLKKTLASLDLPKSVYIYTAVSDGKLEKANGIESPVELIVLCGDKTRSTVEKRIDTLVRSGLMPMDDRVEWKDPNREPLSTCNLTKTVIPSRFLHNLPLVGTQKQLDSLVDKFVIEVQKMRGSDRKNSAKSSFRLIASKREK